MEKMMEKIWDKIQSTTWYQQKAYPTFMTKRKLWRNNPIRNAGEWRSRPVLITETPTEPSSITTIITLDRRGRCNQEEKIQGILIFRCSRGNIP